MSGELMQSYYFLARYLVDILLVCLFLSYKLNIIRIPFLSRRKKRRKKFSWKRSKKKYTPVLKFFLLAYLVAYIIIPVGVGSFYSRAKYFPQYLEAHKLRTYYMAVSILPGTTPSDMAIRNQITKVAQEYSMHPALIRAIVMTESSGNQFALSPTGGCGLMQVMPNTYFSLQGGNPFAVNSNLRAGTKYLRKLYRRFGGNLDMTIAAYNAGPSAVARYGGVPPFRETQNYVVKVRKLYALYKIG